MPTWNKDVQAWQFSHREMEFMERNQWPMANIDRITGIQNPNLDPHTGELKNDPLGLKPRMRRFSGRKDFTPQMDIRTHDQGTGGNFQDPSHRQGPGSQVEAAQNRKLGR